MNYRHRNNPAAKTTPPSAFSSVQLFSEAMWSSYLLENLGRIASLTALICLCSCDRDFFGAESREIAGGYRLKRSGNPNQFALMTPRDRGGLIIDEIGWHAPVILARASGSQYWNVIDTAHAQHIRTSDTQRKSNPVYQSIQINSAETAWAQLKDHERLW